MESPGKNNTRNNEDGLEIKGKHEDEYGMDEGKEKTKGKTKKKKKTRKESKTKNNKQMNA
jgi:hypothetical protein